MSGMLNGADLVHQLWTAARAEGLPLAEFVKPLTSSPAKFIRQLRMAARPGAMTVTRIRALIAGEPVPPTTSRAPGIAAARPHAEDLRAEIERRRALAEAAAEHRRPGETLHAAVRRVELELQAV